MSALIDWLGRWLGRRLDWVQEHLVHVSLLAVVSIVVLVGSLWICHKVLVSVEADYFQRQHKPFEQWRTSRPVLWWTLVLGKNLFGALLMVAGLIMFVTPGQGIITLVLGLALVDLPGKQRLMRRIVAQPSVLKVINRIRARAGRSPLEIE